MAARYTDPICTKITAADLSSSAYCVVDLTSASKAQILTGATPWFGVLTDDVANGATTEAPVSIQRDGIAKVKLGGTVAVGDKLRATTSGNVIATTTTGHYYGGIAVRGGASGEIGEVDLSKNGLVA